MKYILPLLLIHVQALGQVRTTGSQSPAIIADTISIIYEVRADAIYAILEIYAQEGLTLSQCRNRTENILKKYKKTTEKRTGAGALSNATKANLGFPPTISNALDWDLFANKYYLSTSGFQSPAIMANGAVTIWYGVPPAVLRALAEHLEVNKLKISDFEKQLEGLAKKYNDLKIELETYGPGNPNLKKAEALLDEGKLEEVESLLKNDYFLRRKGLAYEGYILGKAEELLLQYDSASFFYQSATQDDPNNSKYLRAYAVTEGILAHYETSISILNKVLEIEIEKIKDSNKIEGDLYNEIGFAWRQKSKYNLAIQFYQKALIADSLLLGAKHKNIAVIYNNIGEIWREKGNYDRAISFYNKALEIDTNIYGKVHQQVAIRYNNLALAWGAKGYYEISYKYLQTALHIDSMVTPKNLRDIARDFNNIGAFWYNKGDYDCALEYYEAAGSIDKKFFGDKHPIFAMRLNNIGEAWRLKGYYKYAFQFHKQSLEIDSAVFGLSDPSIARDYNNMALALQYDGKIDSALLIFQQALIVDSLYFGTSHPSVARDYNNIGALFLDKKDYDCALEYYEKALAIDYKTYGSENPKTSVRYNNIGVAWDKKKNYEVAIDYFNKCLAIDTFFMGNNHPLVATRFHNLATSLDHRQEYLQAIEFYKKALKIRLDFFGMNHPDTRASYQCISRSNNNEGLDLLRQKKYEEAKSFLQEALSYAESIEDWELSLSSLNNLGSLYKAQENFKEGITILEKGITRAMEIKKKSRKLQNPSTLRRIYYHRIGCLAGLGRKEEAEIAAKILIQECQESNDTRTLEDLKKDGWFKN